MPVKIGQQPMRAQVKRYLVPIGGFEPIFPGSASRKKPLKMPESPDADLVERNITVKSLLRFVTGTRRANLARWNNLSCWDRLTRRNNLAGRKNRQQEGRQDQVAQKMASNHTGSFKK